jgi:Phage major capsid protein E
MSSARSRISHAICGADFFDDLVTHSEVEKAYKRYLGGTFLRQARRGACSSEYAGILLGEYRGRVGSVDSPTRARPTSSRSGCRGWSGSTTPADFVETANTGVPRAR